MKLFPTATRAPVMPRGTRTGTGGDEELEKDSQANLSQWRLELRELAQWAEITRKCAVNGEPIHVREAVCAKQRFDEKKAQIDALTSRRPNHCGVDRVRDGKKRLPGTVYN